jgi:hypothetical protein
MQSQPRPQLRGMHRVSSESVTQHSSEYSSPGSTTSQGSDELIFRPSSAPAHPTSPSLIGGLLGPVDHPIFTPESSSSCRTRPRSLSNRSQDAIDDPHAWDSIVRYTPPRAHYHRMCARARLPAHFCSSSSLQPPQSSLFPLLVAVTLPRSGEIH